jgi:hypothetical protein
MWPGSKLKNVKCVKKTADPGCGHMRALFSFIPWRPQIINNKANIINNEIGPVNSMVLKLSDAMVRIGKLLIYNT